MDKHILCSIYSSRPDHSTPMETLIRQLPHVSNTSFMDQIWDNVLKMPASIKNLRKSLRFKERARLSRLQDHRKNIKDSRQFRKPGHPGTTKNGWPRSKHADLRNCSKKNFFPGSTAQHFQPFYFNYISFSAFVKDHHTQMSHKTCLIAR
ncbi:hypothetical protein D8674_042879 [Pyrus ussuriensis x Pyrus communis]|uniref:Uncharacterized protein n=1 Tax=Pyrus ussuriensis x Pyrus communis TaxID=2448454 RepID=A0A5N5FQL0_9ROSA|nr:hypothetical protein D8674_042879 [Pyrus ussuriensis x Pyrus communis]